MNVLPPHKKELHVLVLGRTGSGKSTLINSMLGDHLAQQSYSPIPTQHDIVEIHTQRIADFEIFIYDTPGFFDSRISPEELLTRLKTSYPEGFDLIILCHRIIDRFDDTNSIWLESFCKHYHNGPPKPDIIVALTFANFFLDYNEVSDLKYSAAKEEVLKRKTADFKTLFNKMSATKSGMQFFQHVPFVAIGSPRQPQLPTSNDWLDDLWTACYNQIEKDAQHIVNVLCLQKNFDDKRVRTTATGLCGASSLVIATASIVPSLSASVDKVMETSRKYRSLTPKKCPLSLIECSTSNNNVTTPLHVRDEIDSGQLEQRKDFNKSSQHLPTVKPEELSSDIFEALGLK